MVNETMLSKNSSRLDQPYDEMFSGSKSLNDSDENEEIADLGDFSDVNKRNRVYAKFRDSFPNIFGKVFEVLNKIRFEELIPDAKVLQITKAMNTILRLIVGELTNGLSTSHPSSCLANNLMNYIAQCTESPNFYYADIYFQELPTFILPKELEVEMPIDGKESEFDKYNYSYTSPIQIIKKLILPNKSIVKEILRQQQPQHQQQQQQLFDSLYSGHFGKTFLGALSFTLHFDNFTTAGKKILACYMDLPACVPERHRAGRHSVFSVFLAPRYCSTNKDRKINLVQLLNNRLLPELKQLLQHGFYVDNTSLELVECSSQSASHIPCRLIILCCDNLAAHELIGFPMSFSADSFRCRWCYADGETCNRLLNNNSFRGGSLLETVNNSGDLVRYCPPEICNEETDHPNPDRDSQPTMKRLMSMTCPHKYNIAKYVFKDFLDYRVYRYLFTVSDLMHDLNEGIIPETISLLLEIIRDSVPTRQQNDNNKKSRRFEDDIGRGGKCQFDTELKETVSGLKMSHGNVFLERVGGKYELRGTAVQKFEFFFQV